MKRWYTIQTKPRSEIRANMGLRNAGVETYLPIIVSDSRYTKRRVEALFPSYLFIHMDAGQDDFYPITKTPGVVKVLRLGRDSYGNLSPTPVPNKYIDSLLAAEDSMGIRSDIKSSYAPGDAVRVKSGSMRGYEGIINQLKNRNGEQRVCLLIGALAVELRAEELEPVT